MPAEYHDALWPPLPPNPPPALLATAHSVSQLPSASRPRPSTANRFRLRTSASAAALARPRTAGGGAAISPAVQKQLESLRASHSRLATLVAGPISPPRPATASRPLTAPAASRVDAEAAPEKVAYSAAELMATPLEASPLAEAAPAPHVSLEERVDATLRCMRASPLFAEWFAFEAGRATLLRIAREATMRDVRRYDVVYREGQPARNGAWYLVLRGTVELVATRGTRTTKPLLVGAGGSFGEEALVLDATPMPRSFTASARERCQLLLLPSRCFAAADVRHLVRSCGTSRAATLLALEAQLSLTPLFANVSPTTLGKIAPLWRYLEVGPGEPLVHEGERSTVFFVLLYGSVVVTKAAARKPSRLGAKASGGGDVVLAVIKAEAELPYFGEACIVGERGGKGAGGQNVRDSLSAATVTARERCGLLRLGSERAHEFLAALPTFAKTLMERKQLLKRTNMRLVEAFSTEKFSKELAAGGKSPAEVKATVARRTSNAARQAASTVLPTADEAANEGAARPAPMV